MCRSYRGLMSRRKFGSHSPPAAPRRTRSCVDFSTGSSLRYNPESFELFLLGIVRGPSGYGGDTTSSRERRRPLLSLLRKRSRTLVGDVPSWSECDTRLARRDATRALDAAIARRTVCRSSSLGPRCFSSPSESEKFRVGLPCSSSTSTPPSRVSNWNSRSALSTRLFFPETRASSYLLTTSSEISAACISANPRLTRYALTNIRRSSRVVGSSPADDNDVAERLRCDR
mmetsp:Transcript_14028/g.60072  ORF Transcript_14028/g.60072 Transcript_14028/m.60072 type:complete len:229 (+) Transcript_14028:1005-1691(+)